MKLRHQRLINKVKTIQEENKTIQVEPVKVLDTIKVPKHNSRGKRIKMSDEERAISKERKKLLSNLYAQNYAATFPERVHANQLLVNAVIKGDIIKEPCYICDSTTNIIGHHFDYSKPLEVFWLCMKHHKWIHSEII